MWHNWTLSKVCGLPRDQGKVRYTQMSSEPPPEYVQQPDGSVVRVLAAYNINRIEPDILCSLDINGVTVPNLVVDTGSDASLLDIHTFDKHFLREALTPCQDSLSSYTHTKIKVIGCFPASVSYKSQTSKGIFHIVNTGVSLIGKNLISALSLKIDGKSLTVNSCDISNKVNPNISSTCTVATEFPDLFTDDIGLIKGFKHKIKVYPDVKPVQHKLRRIPLSVRDAVSRELQKLQDADIIEPVNEASE